MYHNKWISATLSVRVRQVGWYTIFMPKVTRTQTSFFGSPTVRFVAALFVITAAGFGMAVFLGYSDKGAIDINKKIAGTNQDGFATHVNQLSGNSTVNGGLHPTGDAPTPPPPAPAPEPTPAATTTATTTAASSTPLHPAGATPAVKKK